MTVKTIFFPMVFHFHQPVDNFDWVYDDCFDKAYGPLIDSIYDVPEVRITLHFSGNLLEWFINNKPKYIQKLKKMASRGQIEIIGGGYYEPIYAIIPQRDRIAQMKKLSELVKNEFNLEVKGAWLSERVWEPNYPSFLSDAGLEYVIVDDNHFRSCGLTQEETLYTYITEDEGKTLRIFPINEPIRYLTPWKPTPQTIEYLKSVADEKGDRIAVLISDAEKMGVWGSTHEFCYVEGKGHQEGDNGKPFVLCLLEQVKNHDWIKSITLSEYIERYPARDLIYLPTASYDKMEEWVLPTKVRRKFKGLRKALREDEDKQDEYQFLKGGFWRYFLVKYPESNNMHKKMIHVRQKLIEIENQVEKVKEKDQSSLLKEKIEEAWDEIYKSQCNDCYWHGMFGGIYLQFLRFSVYTRLINAEKLIDELNEMINPEGKKSIINKSIDFNKDSKMDHIVESDVLNAYFNPSEGGVLFELDYKPKSYNLLNTLSRWEEAYHDKEKLEEENIKNDRYRKSMFRVRIFHDDATLEKIEADTYYEFGDFIDGNFKVVKAENNGEKAHLLMEKAGSIKIYHSDDRFKYSISKEISIKQDEITFMIRGKIDENSESSKETKDTIKQLKIGMDIPFFFNGEPKEFKWKDLNESMYDEKNDKYFSAREDTTNEIIAYDKTYDLTFQLTINSSEGPVNVIRYPIIAFAYTDTGYREIYQGLCTIPNIKLKSAFWMECKIQIS